MKKIKYFFKNNVEDYQIRNLIYRLNFLHGIESEKICFFNESKILEISFEGADDKVEKILKIISSYDVVIKTKKKMIYCNYSKNARIKSKTIYKDLIAENLIVKEQDGVFLYFGIFCTLYNFLIKYFRSKMFELGANEVYLPSLLSFETLNVSRYIEKNSHLCNFVLCNDEECYSKKSILTPAACQPLYKIFKKLKGKEAIFTGFCKVYRNEGKNYKEVSRLREFGVQELVYISTQKNVLNFKNKCLQKIEEIIQELDLTACIETASDMFFENEFEQKTCFQLAMMSKIEVNIPISKKENIACASLNVHGSFFSKSWQIYQDNDNFEASMCIGFGIERWCYAILCQYGTNKSMWPKQLKCIMDSFRE